MFKGNPEVLSEGEVYSYSQDEIKEIIKCKEDPIYFSETYMRILTIDEGVRVIKLKDFQKKVLKAFFETPDNKRHTLLMAPRQCGKCVCANEMVTVRDKITGEVSKIKMLDLFNNSQSEKD